MFDYNQWYAQHGADVNARRKRRYGEDPKYRERVQAHNADSRKRTRAQRRAARNEEEKAKATTNTPRWKETTVTSDGAPVKAFSIGALAAITRRSIQSLRAWEQAGIIPGADARSARGDRLYTVPLLERIYDTLEREGRLRETGRQHAAVHHLAKTVRFADGTEKVLPLFLVGALAKGLGRTIVTVQSWIRLGALPETPLRASIRQYRLYTEPMIAAAVKRLREVGDFRASEERRQEFHDKVHADWKAAGFLTATLVEGEPVASEPPPVTPDPTPDT